MITEPTNKVGRLFQLLESKGLNRDVLLGLALLIFALVTLVWLIPFGVEVQQAGGMAVKPTFFPYGITAILVVLSLALIIKGAKAPSSVERAEDKKLSPAVLIVILVMLGTFFSLKYLGMVPSGILAVILLIRLFNYRNWPRTIIFAVVFVVLLFLFFEKIAQVDIPRGILFEDLY